MDWLDAAALFVLAWFGEKLKRLAKSVLDIIWFLIWCTSSIRCLVVVEVYIAFLEAVVALLKAGQLNGAVLKATKRFKSWANPKMVAWMERTGPETPAWQDTIAQLERNRARKKAAAP